MTQGWRALTREQLDWAYDQRFHAPNMQEVMARLTAAGHQAQAVFKQRQRIAYGTEPIEMLDWYSCQKEGAPVLFFVHGGAWRSGEAKDVAFGVQWLTEAGFDVVIPDFSVVQDVGGDLQVLVNQLCAAFERVLKALHASQSEVHLCGHSSGAHLAACLAVRFASCDNLRSLTACSGMYDLEPVSLSSRNLYVKFTQEVIENLSPIRYAHQFRIPVNLLVGSLESPEFMRQAQAFHAQLDQHQAFTRLTVGEGLNHFEILETLQTYPQGLFAQCLHSFVKQLRAA
ncbi:MAG: alpha/beta hydrolase [Betaproteobacteria bacterium]|nr:alpha/beta hydrolase [Betaproteobacteria bacterium]NBY71833.1 alpha/beta hydrolase [Betaproteobacteria bacterium]NDD13617.1 alpha/beta hydrolase [Betaproteobacteria bacterium]